jgi:TldD protein
MPVDSEPFSVHPLEIRDYLGGLVASIKRYAPLGHGEAIRPTVECRFRTQDQAFGSTVGTYYTQRLHRIEGRLEVEVERRRPGDSWQDKRAVDLLTPAGAGWEYFRDQPLCDAALALVDEIHADATLPIKPVDVNRYDVVLDAFGVSKILSGTVGCATELDRILGYEANKGGTSYLREPFDMLDSFAIGTSLLTVTANRSEAGGAATVKWDDEGVQPRNVTLVEKGIVRDLQTTRESAGWLSAGLSGKPAARNHVFQSHGCAASDTAGYGVICLTANLKMVPSTEQRRFDDLIAGLPKGVAIKSLWCDMDFQQASGHGMGRAYEIKDGKISARLSGAGVLFRTVELWKSLKTIGGPQSARRFGHGVGKGEPMQLGYHSVTAVPATFSNVSVIDIYRRG